MMNSGIEKTTKIHSCEKEKVIINMGPLGSGLHPLVIGNQPASWFPIQVDADQGPRGWRLGFKVPLGSEGGFLGISISNGASSQ